MQMMVCVLFALPYKKEKKHIFVLAIIAIVEYCLVKLVALDISIFWLSYVIEFSGTLLILALFNSGNIWRNFTISWFNFQCGNMLIVLEGVVSKYLFDINSIIVFGATGENDLYIFVEMILMLLNVLIALSISRKLFKISYNRDGKVYNIAETRRLLKERKELKDIIEKNYAQYANAVKSNKELETIKDYIKDGSKDIGGVYGVGVSILI